MISMKEKRHGSSPHSVISCKVAVNMVSINSKFLSVLESLEEDGLLQGWGGNKFYSTHLSFGQ